MSFPDAYVPVPGNYSPQERDDLFDSIPGKLDKAGGTMTGAISMGGNKITNVANGTSSADAVNKSQLDGKLSISGGTMTGAIAMGNKKITGLATPTANADAATKKYVDDHSVPPATAAPLMDGTADVGTATKYAREDHVHPSDTSKADLTALAPIFSTERNYHPGQYVCYDGKIYQFVAEHTAGSWNSEEVIGGNNILGHFVTAGATNASQVGIYATAEGYGTKAPGAYSHAGGRTSEASGPSSHALGYSVVANHRAQMAFGSWNVADDSEAESNQPGNFIELVGNGSAATGRSNARTLDWYGNQWLAGKLQALNNDNYLLNWNFIYPVNQLGVALNTAVSATDPATYNFLDCWKLTSGTATLTSTGVTLNGTMTQTIERAPTGTVTASVLCSSGEATATYSSGALTLTSSGGTIVAVKLEDGGVQTLYRDTTLLDPAPNPTIELLKCQRYRYVIDGTQNTGLRVLGMAIAYDSTHAVINLRMPVPMRALPTMNTTAANIVLRPNPSGPTGAVTVTGIAVGSFQTGQQTTLILTTTDTLTLGAPYLAIMTNAAYKIIFDANL